MKKKTLLIYFCLGSWIFAISAWYITSTNWIKEPVSVFSEKEQFHFAISDKKNLQELSSILNRVDWNEHTIVDMSGNLDYDLLANEMLISFSFNDDGTKAMLLRNTSTLGHLNGKASERLKELMEQYIEQSPISINENHSN